MSDYYLLSWDVTTEILLRLPVKSLLRFKCVSKSLYDLISNDPLFQKKHLHRHQSSLKVLVPLFKTLGGCAFSCSVSSLSSGYFYEDTVELQLPVLGCFYNSCDGLFCLGVFEGDVIIWNPSTRETKKIQGYRISSASRRGLPPEKGIQCSSWIGYSLAHDSRSNVYKLLGLFKYNDHNTYRMCFYSMEMAMWRYIEECLRPPCDFVNFRGGCTTVNGAFHWLGSSEGKSETPHVVVSSDISNETYGSFAMPQAICDTTKSQTLYVLKDMLSLFCQHNSELCCDIWVMKEYSVVGSMTRMFRISCVELPNLFYRALYMFDDDTIMIYKYPRKGGRFLCNSGAGTSKINEVPYVYSESLISPHDIKLGARGLSFFIYVKDQFLLHIVANYVLNS